MRACFGGSRSFLFSWDHALEMQTVEWKSVDDRVCIHISLQLPNRLEHSVSFVLPSVINTFLPSTFIYFRGILQYFVVCSQVQRGLVGLTPPHAKMAITRVIMLDGSEYEAQIDVSE